MERFRALLSVAAFLGAGPVLASSVYLNGVQVDGITNQKFDKATVTFDASGNVHIDAPGYQVQTLGPQTQGTRLVDSTVAIAQPTLSKHYFLVTQQTAPNMTGYDIDVFVNSKWIRKLKSNEEQVVVDMGKYLAPGPNKILFAAKKSTGDRKSFSPQHVFSVIIGEGNMGGDQVMIDNPLLSFKRTAADTDDVSEEFSLNAR